jgi:hypothetical protein
MKKTLTRKEEVLFWFSNGKKQPGKNSEMTGECSRLRGDCSGLRGDCSGLLGNCSGLLGDCSGLEGDLDAAELTNDERARGIGIELLVRSI